MMKISNACHVVASAISVGLKNAIPAGFIGSPSTLHFLPNAERTRFGLIAIDRSNAMLRQWGYPSQQKEAPSINEIWASLCHSGSAPALAVFTETQWPEFFAILERAGLKFDASLECGLSLALTDELDHALQSCFILSAADLPSYLSPAFMAAHGDRLSPLEQKFNLVQAVKEGLDRLINLLLRRGPNIMGAPAEGVDLNRTGDRRVRQPALAVLTNGSDDLDHYLQALVVYFQKQGEFQAAIDDWFD